MGSIRKLKVARTVNFHSTDRRRFDFPDLVQSNPSARGGLAVVTVDLVRILTKKNIPLKKANAAAGQALLVAGSQRYARARQVADQQRRNAWAQIQTQLADRLENLSRAVQNASSSERAACNEIVIRHQWSCLDSETFAELMHSLSAALTGPTDALNSGETWDGLVELWEALAPPTRTAAEAELRHCVQPKDANEFFSNLISLLRGASLPKNKKLSAAREFGFRMGEIWSSLGLHVGLAYNKSGQLDGPFVQFCTAALRAVGDATKISRREVLRIKAKHSSKKTKALALN